MTPDFLLKVGSIVLLLGGLIFVHELGHFLVAKALGVKVVRFSVGFGPRLLGFTRGETEYRVALLPLGGYVKMAGDDPTEAPLPEDRGRGFLEQSPFRRFLIAVAGPAANLVFPVLLYLAIGMAENGKPTPGPVVGAVSPGTPAAQAGLRPGDRILTVEAPGAPASPVRWFGDLRDQVSPHPGVPLRFEIERDGQRRALEITPAAEPDVNPVETVTRGVIGVTPFYAAALVAPARPGAAGPVEPFDLVVKAGGKPIRNLAGLQAALAASGCAPLDLEVQRESPAADPRAPAARGERPAWGALALPQVPTCAAGGPALLPADPSLSAYVGQVAAGGPAEAAGLRRGDAIAAVNGHPLRSARELAALSGEFKAGQATELRLADGRTVRLTPGEQAARDEATGDSARKPVLGFAPGPHAPLPLVALVAEMVPLTRRPGEIAARAAGNLWDALRLTAKGIWRILTGKISFKTVGGPIMLFGMAAQAAEDGLETFLFTMALISVNLGLMNLLPIPVLDGGHLAACTLEAVTRRRPSLRAREIANLVGLAMLLLLMVAVFRNDIARNWTQITRFFGGLVG